MSARPRRVVLVTGTPRSGTTPIGDLLAAAPGAATLYEPLNFHVGDRRVSRYFEVPDAGGFEAACCDELIDDVARLRLRLRPGVFPEDRGLRRLAKHVVGSQTRMSYRRARMRPRVGTLVWKDPFAVFLVDRIIARLDAPVLATVRPPAAVAASFKRLGWSFDVAGLVDRLGPAGEVHRPLLEPQRLATPAGNATVLWHVVNSSLLDAQRRLPSVHIVDMDRVVADRLAMMRSVFGAAGLSWTPAVQERVRRSGDAAGPARPTGSRAHGGARDVSAVNSYWSDVLTDDELTDVRAINDGLWAELRAASL